MNKYTAKTNTLASLYLTFIALFPIPATAANEPDTIPIAIFSAMKITDIKPTGWQSLDFDSIQNKTAYFLSRDENITAVKAISHASASGLFKPFVLSPEKYPILKWNWKIENVLAGGNVMTKEGDDYPARIYVAFDYDPQRLIGSERLKYRLYSLLHNKPPPLAVINYVWGSHAPVGTRVANAYSTRVKMIVVQSGKEKTKQWLTEERNIYQDYLQAFGEPPGNITGIAIMTDTDNTRESATAWYGDITFHAKEKSH